MLTTDLDELCKLKLMQVCLFRTRSSTILKDAQIQVELLSRMGIHPIQVDEILQVQIRRIHIGEIFQVQNQIHEEQLQMTVLELALVLLVLETQ